MVTLILPGSANIRPSTGLAADISNRSNPETNPDFGVAEYRKPSSFRDTKGPALASAVDYSALDRKFDSACE